MNITFSGVGTQGGTDGQSSSTGPTKGQGNAIFANFSNLLMSAAEEGLDSNSSSEILNVHLSDFENRSLGGVSAQEFMNQIISDDSMIVDRKLQVLMAEHGVDGLVNHLENGGNLDASVHFNATAAFMDTRLGALPADNIVDKEASGLTLLTFMDLLGAIDPSNTMNAPDGFDDNLHDINILGGGNIANLNDLMISAPVQLELSDAADSSILFDIRDLKNNLGDMLALDANGFETDVTPSEVIIPQIIPISADSVINTDMVISAESAINYDNVADVDDENVADVDDEVAISSNQVYALMDEYDPFVSVKVELLDAQGRLGATEHIELPAHPGEELGLNIVGVTRTVEIDTNVDPRSKLLIGLSIPENTSLHDIPDFVRFKIRLSKNISPDIRSEVKGNHGLNSISKGPIISGDKSTLEITKIAQQLVSSLQEMSTLSSRPTQIVVKTGASEPVIPSFNMQNMVPLEINKLVLTDINEASALTDAESISANQTHIKVMLDEIVKPVASMNNDARIGLATSALALDTELKYFLSKKDFKNNFFTKEIETDLAEQKIVSTNFNPKFFLEAVETLRVKQVTLPNLSPKVEQQVFGPSDSNTFTKADNQTAVQASSSNNPMALASSMSGKISLYDAQYASRISMLVVDKVLNGKENFEIHLEPESFGKIKVNVLMEKQVLDIRMVAETQAAASLLRANEESLLQITNQNGMKLAGFSVGLQSGTDQQRQNSNQNRNRLTDQANSVLGLDKTQNSQTIISYRTSTGLNLIA